MPDDMNVQQDFPELRAGLQLMSADGHPLGKVLEVLRDVGSVEAFGKAGIPPQQHDFARQLVRDPCVANEVHDGYSISHCRAAEARHRAQGKTGARQKGAGRARAQREGKAGRGET